MKDQARNLLRLVFLAAAVLFLDSGCARPIANRISKDEYDLYRAWLNQHPPKDRSSFFIDDHASAWRFVGDGCQAFHSHIDRALAKELTGLGDAEYLLRQEDITPYSVTESLQLEAKRLKHPVYGVTFSRVAFDGTRHHALFAVSSESITPPLAGFAGGGTVLADFRDGHWYFRHDGCMFAT